jgi:prevent-host-death family protein
MENVKLPDIQFSASDLQRQTDDVTHAASRAPVTITKRGKARFVMMSVDDYAALTQGRDVRKAYATSEMPTDLMERLRPEIDRILVAGDQDDA